MVEEEIDKKWENDLQAKFQEKINSLIKDSCEKFDTKLITFEKDIKEKIDNSFNVNQIKNQMNKICRNLAYNNYGNNLITAVLLCLSNIEPFVFYFLDKKNSKNGKNYCSLFVELLDNLWTKPGDKFEPNLIHNQLKETNNQVYKSKNPGTIIKFFLSQLHEELNSDKSNNTEISKLFFVKYKNEQIPLVNLNVIKGAKSIISDYHFNLLDNNADIEDLNNNILIINLNRERDPLHQIKIEYPENLEVKIKGENKKYELISVLFKTNIKLKDDYNYSEQPKYKVCFKNFFNQKWYSYDQNIELIETKNILDDGQKTLLLVYKKKID